VISASKVSGKSGNGGDSLGGNRGQPWVLGNLHNTGGGGEKRGSKKKNEEKGK